MTNKEKEAVQNFVDAAWPFIEKAMLCDKYTVMCGWYPDRTPLTEAGDKLTVGDLRKLRDAYLQNIVGNVFSHERTVVGEIVKDVTKSDILWAKKTFMQSENTKADAEKYWSVSDLKGHFSAAKNDKKNPKPKKNQNTKSVDGMLEYLLSVGYIEQC